MDAHILSQLQAASERVKSILDESDRILDALKMRSLQEPEDHSAEGHSEAMEVDHEGQGEEAEAEAEEESEAEADEEAEAEADDEADDEAEEESANQVSDSTEVETVYSDSDSDVEHCCGFICRRNP